MNLSIYLLSATSSDATDSSSSNSSFDLSTLKDPKIWIVVGVIVVLLLAWYLFRRFIKAKPGYAYVVLKHHQYEGIISENTNDLKSKFLIPFVESISSPIQLKDNLVTSDNLLINDGPDKLYKITYKLTYDVKDIKAYYSNMNNSNFINEHLNTCLRSYAYNGNVDTIINKYVEGEKDLLAVINEELNSFGMDATSFKITSIAPWNAK